EGIRELPCGSYRVADLLGRTGIERMHCPGGASPPHGDELVDVNWKLRPVMMDGQAVLLVQRKNGGKVPAWQSAPKEIVKLY
ncbi:MAG: hypothetical protein L0H63_12940, partial [Nitrococcus sp.]|nr:hypothetical protein [Nitrococcus sp.]